MRVAVSFGAIATAVFLATAAEAQDRVWIQIEARPNQAQGEDRARAWSTAFADVSGYRLNSGWYGVVLGPYAPDKAALRLADLKAQGMIPPDSYITDGGPFRENFWVGGMPGSTPGGTSGGAFADSTESQPFETVPEPGSLLPGATPPATDVRPLAPAPSVETMQLDDDPGATPGQTPGQAPAPSEDFAALAPEAPAPETPAPVVPAPELLPDESPAEARASEALLSGEDRMELQSALKWFGFYDSAIDGAFGRGTRASMAAWQDAQGFEATGILTAAQRTRLIDGYRGDRREFGFETVTEAESGIEIALPLAMVGFDHYEPPFVHYTEKNGSGLRVILISAPGDETTLNGLYDTLQHLALLPGGGPRRNDGRSFTIEGTSPEYRGYAQAELSKGMVKGFILAGPPSKSAALARILPAMKASFHPVGDRALDPGLVPLDAAARSGLVAGLEVQKPRLSRTGFFVDGSGTVVTTAEAVSQCARITLDRETEARVKLMDQTSGIAVLTPLTPLAPSRIASFATAAPRQGAELAVSGYSYEDRLPAPVLTFGTLAENGGLDGETGLSRLAIPVLAGDAGGPVLDASGTVVGMLLPAPAGPRRLPDGVSFAADTTALTAKLAEAGVRPAPATTTAQATPDALARDAAAMTVLVSCWN